jgi:sterol 3beta-glucosyltransferase
VRIGVVTIDSRGGVQPLLALALGLSSAGHDVTFAVPSDQVGWVAAHGVDARPLSVDIRVMLERRQGSLGGRRAQVALARRELPGQLADWMGQTHEALAGVDLVLAGTAGLMVAAPVAEALAVPLVPAHLQPLGPATTRFPGVFFPGTPRWLGGPGRWASHVLTNAAMTLPLRGAIKRARQQALGSRPLRRRGSSGLVLYGFSPRVVPKPGSWGAIREITGYWTVPTAPDERLSPDLGRFLAAGPPPVVVGFGSMPLADPQVVASLSVAAARRNATRVVLLGGWGGLDHGRADDDVLVTAEAPHGLLFPRAAAVVHHGGAGTTGAAVTAGVPSVIIPWGADQPFWAARLFDLGVAGAPIPRRLLSEQTLAAALGRVLTDRPLRQRAAQLGHEVRAETGVRSAVRLVERCA